MTLANPDLRRRRRLSMLLVAVWLAIAVTVLARFLVDGSRREALLAGARAHAPDLSMLAAVPLAMQLHIASTLVALPVGAVLLAGRKGDGLHRRLGWTWVVAMAVATVTPLLALTEPHYGLNVIHATLPLFAVLIPRAVLAARRHDVQLHRRTMRLTYGMLIGAGVFTLIPGRLMWSVFFG